jgi:hypothetical protein
MSDKLNQILERFQSKLSYREQDTRALDISRAAAAGSLGEHEYSEWALISNDPLVVVNYVKTFITTLASKLSSAPFRPQDDKLNEVVMNMRLNSQFTDIYKMTLADGYSFLGLGLDNGKPIANIIDARSIMFNGNDPTLKDATELIVFEVLPKSKDDDFVSDFPSGYVEFDNQNEKVRTSYYYKQDGKINLDIYEEGVEEPSHFEIPNVDRIPVVRFYGEKFELNDKRYHYRGLYYQLAGIIKATALAATKLQIRVAMSDDDNYLANSDAIANYKHSWKNAGVKEFSNYDANGDPINQPVQPIQHDNGFLIQALETWKNVTSDMLGPVVQSGSEAVTREEVLARSEVRDAIANTYLSNMSDSIAEVYRIINSMLTGNTATVIVEGGFIEAAHRNKFMQQIVNVYNLAKESGLNAQGFIFEILANSELPENMKQRVGQLLMQDPFASPKMVELNQQLQKAQQTIQQQTNTITQLRIMASQRMERQAEWVASQERIKRFEIMFKQWQQENKDTQEARMEVLRKLLDNGDTFGAMAMLQAIRQIDNPVLTEPETQMQMNDATVDTLGQFTENNQEVFNNVANLNPNGNQQVPAGPTGPGPGNTTGTNFGQLPTGFPTNGQQPFMGQPFRR